MTNRTVSEFVQNSLQPGLQATSRSSGPGSSTLAVCNCGAPSYAMVRARIRRWAAFLVLLGFIAIELWLHLG